MRTVAIEVPEVTVDRDLIRQSVLRAASAEDDAGNDWSRLVEDEIPEREDFTEFLADMFVLLRTTAGVFGEAGVDGYVVYDVTLKEVDGVVLRVPVATEKSWAARGDQITTIGHGGYLSVWSFYPGAAETMLDFTVETLLRIGGSAQSLVQNLEA